MHRNPIPADAGLHFARHWETLIRPGLRDNSVMRILPEIRCPKCSSANYRLSRWHSHEEKTENPGMLPYRCLGCSHHFLAWEAKRIEALKAIILAGALLSIALAGVVLWAFLGAGDPEKGEILPEGDGLAAPHALSAAGEADAEAPLDKDEAARLPQRLQRSAESGDASAMIRLGLMYKNGVGVLQNYDQAARWIQKAANSGDPKGMLELGRLYRDGVGLRQDFNLAYVWFNRAAAALNWDAVRERDSVSRSLTPEQLQAAQDLSAQM